MFPTAGYFRSTNCPFFVHGLCHRPYCHFRHCKPGVKTSKSKPSPHKNKISGHHDVSKRKETKECTSEGLSESDNKVAVSEVKTGENHSSCDDNKYETKITEVKGILKRQTDEGNEGSISEDSANSLATRSVESRPLATKENNTEEFESDDTDQPIASLTEEEKQIIGLFSQTACGSDSICEDKSSDVRYTASVEDVCSYDSSVNRNATLTKDGRVTSFNTSVLTNMPGIDDCDDVTSRYENKQDGTSIKREPVEVNCCGSADNTTPCSDAQEAMIEEMKTTSGQGGMSQTNDDLSKSEEHDKLLLPKRRKSIQLKTALIDSSAKKRKSQQLLCVADPSSVNSVLKSEKESNKFDKIRGNEDAVKCKSTLNKFLESTSKLWDKVKNMSTEEADSVNEEGSLSSPPKKQKLDHSDASPLKKKSPLKDLSVKKKVKLAEAEINFFDSTKKTSKGRKLEKSNNKEKKLSVRTTKVINHQSKSKDFKRKFAKGVTILVSDDSDTLSPANCQSSSEEESHLKRIWDDFEPNINIPEFEPELPPTRKTQAMDSTAKKVSQTTAPGTQPVNVKKPSSIVNTLGLGKKQRVAHTANHLPRRTSSNANPVRRYPKTLAATVKKDVPTTSSSTMESSVKSSLSFKPIKQRVAHVAKTSAATGSLPRPRIPVEYGAKVPQNQRQRYLDRIIDEYLRLCSTQKEAFEKAVEEETALYERSTRRQVYLNLCVNAIKKLRDMTPQDMAASLPAKAETEKQLTKTVLPSGAVVISSKSPVKQTRPTSPNSGDLTEEVMYDFLLKYLMTEDDLVQNGFPRPCSSVAGKAVMKMKKEQSSRDPSRRICQRCGKPFVVLEDEVYQTKEECVYHAGKLFRKKGEQIRSYSCCQGDAGSPGCCVGQVHVSDEMHDTDGFMTTIVSPLADQRKKIFSMDCEMCYTTGGLELTRITVVNWNLEVVYDTFVMPERTIVDYNTRFSGVTAELLRGVTTTIREVQAVLLSMIHKDTILVGHSLESDLKATKLIHSKVVDTSVVFPHRLGAPYKRALRHLMADHLKKIIQDNVEGHDSFEDAKACLELMRWKVKEDVKKTTRHKTPRLSVG